MIDTDSTGTPDGSNSDEAMPPHTVVATKGKSPKRKNCPKPKKKSPRGESTTSPRRLKVVLEKQLSALEYRKIGYTFAQIADALGYATAQGAYLAVHSALARVVREPAEEILKLELERLDALFAKPYQNALAGDLMALNGCLNVMARKAKLLGLDAPTKSEHSGPNGAPMATVVHHMTEGDMAAAAARLAAKY